MGKLIRTTSFCNPLETVTLIARSPPAKRTQALGGHPQFDGTIVRGCVVTGRHAADSRRTATLRRQGGARYAILTVSAGIQGGILDVVRFRLPTDLRGPEKSETAHALQSVDGVVLRAPTEGPAVGAGSIDPGVLVALIEGGATVVAPAIAAFATFLLTRNPRRGAGSSLRIAVRGSESSVEIDFGKETSSERLAVKVSDVGAILEVEAMYDS